jgi:hypothetical protein
MKPDFIGKIISYSLLVSVVGISIWSYTGRGWDEVSSIPVGYHGQWVNVSYRDDIEGADTMIIGSGYFYFRQSNGWVRSTQEPLVQQRGRSTNVRISSRESKYPNKWTYLLVAEGQDLLRVFRIEDHPARDGDREERAEVVGYFTRRL